MTPEPLAITGLGLISAAGRDAAAFRAALEARRPCLAPLPDAVARDLPVSLGGRVPDEALGGDAGLDRAWRLASLALEEALAAARRDAPAPARVGLALGTALGGTERFEAWARGEETVDPPLRGLVPHALSRRLHAAYGLAGEPTTFCVTCASALYAVEEAWAALALDRLDAVVVGGLDTLSRTIQGGFCALEALSPSAAPGGPAPSDGIVLGEAAAFVVLERPAAARARGARVLGLLTGLGLRADATHVTSPDTSGAGMRAALEAALGPRGPAGLDAVSLTAPGSPVYAETYANALAPLLGPGWRERTTTWEGEVGHLLAASGTAGLVHACQVLAGGVPGGAARPRRVAALTVGFGGLNGATVVDASEEGA